MNDLLPLPVAVQVPAGALAWSALRGFITEPAELLEAEGDGELLAIDVIDDERWVHRVEGEAPLAVAIRQDRELAELHDRASVAVAAKAYRPDHADHLEPGAAVEQELLLVDPGGQAGIGNV